MAKIKGVPKPTERPFGQCDWGDCDDWAVDWRCDNKQGWLPVCLIHLSQNAKTEKLEATLKGVIEAHKTGMNEPMIAAIEHAKIVLNIK